MQWRINRPVKRLPLLQWHNYFCTGDHITACPIFLTVFNTSVPIDAHRGLELFLGHLASLLLCRANWRPYIEPSLGGYNASRLFWQWRYSQRRAGSSPSAWPFWQPENGTFAKPQSYAHVLRWWAPCHSNGLQMNNTLSDFPTDEGWELMDFLKEVRRNTERSSLHVL